MNLITDRTKSDVLLGTEKGRYGVADLNRVEAAVAELAHAIGKSDQVDVKTDWGLPGIFSAEQWPTEAQMSRYLWNIRFLIVCAIDDAVYWPPLPESMNNLDWEGANQIERALLVVEKYVRGNTSVLGKSVLGVMILGTDAVEDNQITFTIDGTTYNAEENMTFGQWVESEHNTDGFYVAEDYTPYVRSSNGDILSNDVVGTILFHSYDVIVAGYRYVLYDGPAPK